MKTCLLISPTEPDFAVKQNPLISMSAPTPIDVLEYLFHNVGGYLPYPVRSLLSLALRGLYYLPSSVANVLPVILAAFVLYSSVLSMISTLRWALRTTWTLTKWGLVIATIMWAAGIGTGSMSAPTGVGTGVGRAGYWPGHQQYGNVASQLYAAATGNKPCLRNNNLGLLYNFAPAPLRAVSDLASFFSGGRNQAAASSRSTRSTTRGGRRRDQEQAEQINEIAQGWLGSMAGRAWESFNQATATNEDRWAEGRRRRDTQRQRNR